MKDTCVVKAEQAACVYRGSTGKTSMLPDGETAKSRPNGTSLDALLPQLKSISEEQAWAICFLSCMTLAEKNPHVDFDLSMSNLYINSGGTITIVKDAGHAENGGSASSDDSEDEDDGETRPLSEEEVVISLGVLMFGALDYGLSEDAERELSPEMQEVIEKLTTEPEEDDDDSDSMEGCASAAILSPEDESPFVWSPGPVTAPELIKVCEFRLSVQDRPPLTHYQDVCRKMVQEADVLALYHAADGGYIEGMEYLDEAPKNLVRSWRTVIQELLKAEVKLKPTKQVRSYAALHEMILNQMRQGGLVKSLKHVEVTERKPRRDILRDIRQGLKLKPAAERILNEKVRKKTKLETLMDDISTNRAKCGLRPVPEQDKRYRDKPAPDSTTILYRALRRAEMERQQDYVSTAVDDDRPHIRAPGHRNRSSGMKQRRQTPIRRHLRLALENKQAHTRLSSSTSLGIPASCASAGTGVGERRESCPAPVPLPNSKSFMDFKGFSPQSSQADLFNPRRPPSSPLATESTVAPLSSSAPLLNCDVIAVPRPDTASPVSTKRHKFPNASIVPSSLGLESASSSPPSLASALAEPDMMEKLQPKRIQSAQRTLLRRRSTGKEEQSRSTEGLGSDSTGLMALGDADPLLFSPTPSCSVSRRTSLTSTNMADLADAISLGGGNWTPFHAQQALWNSTPEVGLNSLHHHSPRPSMRRRPSATGSVTRMASRDSIGLRRSNSQRRSSRLQSSNSCVSIDRLHGMDMMDQMDDVSSQALAEAADLQPVPMLQDTEANTPSSPSVKSHGKQHMSAVNLLTGTLDQPLAPGKFRHQFLHLPNTPCCTQEEEEDDESFRGGRLSIHRESVSDIEPECRKGAELTVDEIPATRASRSRTTSASQSAAMPLLMTGGLSYKEILSIRIKQTESEIEIEADTGMKIRLRSGKICFVCKKKRFSFFSLIGSRTCILCGRKVCQECITKMVLLDVDFSETNIVSNVEAMDPIEACHGCRLSLLSINQQYKAPDECVSISSNN